MQNRMQRSIIINVFVYDEMVALSLFYNLNEIDGFSKGVT